MGFTQCILSVTSFFFFSDVFNEKNQHLKIIWITVTIVFSLIAIAVCLFVSRKKLAGFLSFYLSLLQGFRDLESGASD